MKKIHLLAVLAALIFGAFGATATAHAGCIAQWQSPSTLNYVASPASMQISGQKGGAQCTTITGNTYHIDWYEQEYEPSTGTWNQITGVFNPGNSFVNNIANHYYPFDFNTVAVPCSAYSTTSTLARMKMIVKNDSLGSTSISYSQGTSKPASCH
jgi:hypothetical protein